MSGRRWLGPVAAAGLLLAACGGTAAATNDDARATSVLRVAIGVDPDTLDPMRQTTTTVMNIVQMVVEPLIRLDQDGQVQPDLATDWQEAPDASSWTFTLRAGVRFSDGTPLDAEAVVRSFDRSLDPSNVCELCGAMTSAVRSVQVLDPRHVRLVMARPLAAGLVLGSLSEPSFAILSPGAIVPGTASYARQERPVGTGPYLLADRIEGVRVTLVRNDAYWGRRPAFARQVFQIEPDATMRESLVRSGDVQVTLLPPASDLPAMQRDSNVKVVLAPGDRLVFLAIDTVDTRQPLLRDRRVRQALNYAINRDAIVRSTLFGAAEPATSAMAPNVFGYCEQTPYAYDPDRARALLGQAGAGGLTISLIAPTGRYIQDFQAAQNVAGELRAVGVNVEGPRTMDWPTYVGTILVPPARATVDAHMLGFAPNILDAADAMRQFEPGQIPPTGLASSYYDNPQVGALLAQAQVEPLRVARLREYCEAQKQVWDDAPMIFLWVQKFPIVYSAQVTDVASRPNESLDTVYARPA
ncbi:MAG TPA: ABC transporter substrate-binding protein [Candidatus Dormibacteraeota bacterium]|nr:ABC transporter substrate-binding protein [Candidatus Dormibacteraeota bacterium]